MFTIYLIRYNYNSLKKNDVSGVNGEAESDLKMSNGKKAHCKSC